MNHLRKSGTLATATGGLAAIALAVLPATSAAAATKSFLFVVQPPGTTATTSVDIDYAISPTASVTVKLDSNCPNAYGNGQVYGIADISSTPAVATVDPASVAGLHCGAAGSSFTLTGVSNGTTTVRFDPVAKNTGLQKKLGGVNVTVTVTNAPTDGNPGGPPPAHKRPAAPAVTNAYLDDPNLKAACKTTYASAGHHWRGALLRTIAHWSAQNHLSSKKDNTTLYPTDNAWIVFVQNHVNGVCGYIPV
jgi:hypothetical protein